MSEKYSVKIIEEKPIDSKEPIVIIGLPDVGLVGTISAFHMVQELKMEYVGFIESDLLPPMMFVHKTEIYPPVRVYKLNNILLVTSEIPISEYMIRPLAKEIVAWAKAKNAKFIITLGGIAAPNRMEIDMPECFSVFSDKSAGQLAQKSKLTPLEEGVMVGMYAELLKHGRRQGIPVLTILAQSFDRYPDPGAAASVLNKVSELIDVRISVEELVKRAEEIRIKMREIMQKTDQTLRRIGKAQELEVPPMYT
ncbi:MAG: proteasome assembly chaperone family protein [Candidatus Heimdallarchaeaceae archaeon]